MSAASRVAAAAVALAVGVQVGLAVGVNEVSWQAPAVLGWTVVVAASLCLVAGVALAWTAHRRNHPELGFVAAFFTVASILPLVHGITIPGWLYGPNPATAAAVVWVVPIGFVALIPTLAPRSRLGRAAGRHWRAVYVAVTAACAVIGIWLLASPQSPPLAAPGTSTAIAIAVTSFAATVWLSARHVRLARLAAHPGPLAVAAGYILVGAAALAMVADGMWAPHMWFAHGIDITGVFAATIGGIVLSRRGLGREVLEHVVAVDPHSALEVGLSPAVHEFVSELERKDEITRDHVIRTGALAVEVAGALRLDVDTVRQAALVGLLHDIGKLAIPDEILTKPDRLTDDEFAIVRTHTTEGDRILSGTPALADIAPLVRSHHERVDGRGYPDGLRSGDIPLVARIVAACDAYDAMMHTRHYRSAMGWTRTAAILREHAGAQWDAAVVETLLEVTRAAGSGDGGEPTATGRFDGVGRRDDLAEHRIGCECLPDVLLDVG